MRVVLWVCPTHGANGRTLDWLHCCQCNAPLNKTTFLDFEEVEEMCQEAMEDERNRIYADLEKVD